MPQKKSARRDCTKRPSPEAITKNKARYKQNVIAKLQREQIEEMTELRRSPTDFTPRPTEFRGIVYRSKCEAMFALWLHLKHGDNVVVQYEPDLAELDDYVVDFVVSQPQESSPSGRLITFDTCIYFIEYKPSRLTFTYISEVSKKIKNIIERECTGHNVRVGGFIYFGSVFTCDRGLYSIQRDNEIGSCCDCNWLNIYERQIRDYRFDLESER